MLADLPKPTPRLQFDSSSMCVLNINEMDSISHSHGFFDTQPLHQHNLTFWATLQFPPPLFLLKIIQGYYFLQKAT